ncbi:MAG: hypothetical protein JNL89_08880 [Rhodanobacteraceae bacterium]|nr:hypothetical protein [Rhodanobacteraceae bacterium]
MNPSSIKLFTAALVCALSLEAGVALASTSDVKVLSQRSVGEMTEYVESVDRRLQKGRYDVVENKERTWIIEQIAAMRKALQDADPSQEPSADLLELASEFETGMIRIEEGGIVCRQERRTGSRMVEQKCYSKKRMDEDAEKSRSTLQRIRRPSQVPKLPGEQ